jgi:hypothetical protein
MLSHFLPHTGKKGGAFPMTTPRAVLIIIFLDIDGVLLPFSGSGSAPDQLFPDRTLGALSIIFARYPEAVLVLSSTWRVRKDFCDQILDSFANYNERNGNSLPLSFFDVTDINLHSERQWEIRDWLNKNKSKSVSAWVAIDDEDLLEGKMNDRYRSEFEGHVVKTMSPVGLTQSDAEDAIELIHNQLGMKTYCNR